MNEHGYPCDDHAAARADRNRGPHNKRSISTSFLAEETFFDRRRSRMPSEIWTLALWAQLHCT
jgi:hypothetical protein